MTATDKKFYHLFWTDVTCQNVFSVHKGQLLEDEVELIFSKEKFYAQRLVFTNSLKRKTGTQIIKRTENENIELVHNFQKAIKKYFDEAKMEVYVNSKFGKAVDKVQTELNKTGGFIKILIKLAGAFQEEKNLYKLLADYELIPKEIKSREQFITYCELEIEKQIQTFLKKENLSELAVSIDLVSTYYNLKIKNNLVSSTKHYTDILYDTDNFKSRAELFDSLYEIGVLKGGKLKSYYECVICPPNTFNGILTTNLRPQNLILKCPCCQKEVFYIVPYELDETIYSHIVHKDGLLFFAIQALLQQNDYLFKINQTYLSDVEIDICLTDAEEKVYEMIEVKMFKTDRPEDTQIANIKDAIGKMKKAIDKLSQKDAGFKVIKYSLVTNINNDSIYKEAVKELGKDLKGYNILLYTMANFYSKIKEA